MSKITNILLILVAVLTVGLTSCNKYEDLERMDTENTYRDGELDGSIDDDGLDGVNDGDDDDDESSATKGDGKGDSNGGVNDGDEDEDESSARTR